MATSVATLEAARLIVRDVQRDGKAAAVLTADTGFEVHEAVDVAFANCVCGRRAYDGRLCVDCSELLADARKEAG